MYDYTMVDNVALLTMNHNENRFNPETIKAFSHVLDKIETDTTANAMVITSAHEKIWCNGIDVDWLLPEIQKNGEKAMNRFLAALYILFKRLLMVPMPTIAAINGHAFGAGAFLAFAHDFRFMRSDRGWICIPEVDMGMTLGPVFMAVAQKVLPMTLLEEMQYTARRMTALDCENRYIIMKACPQKELLPEALTFAKGLNKKRNHIRKMKQETLAPILKIIDETVALLKA